MKKYEHVISLGYFCGPSSELEKIGLRDASYPFDWLISDMEGIMDCIKNDFKGFLKEDTLYQYKSNKGYYKNTEYNFHFYHDFSNKNKLKDQLPSVEEKYSRRIERFKENTKCTTLFVRYVENQNEMNFILNNYNDVISQLRESNESNDLLLISNSEVDGKQLEVFKVEKDKNDSVARLFLGKNKKLEHFLNSDIYDAEKRQKNIEKYKRKQKKQMRFNFVKKAMKKLRNIIKKDYIHSRIIDN